MTHEELDQRLLLNMHSPLIVEGVQLVKRAREFAIAAHGLQRYGNAPYLTHLEAVENVLIEFNHITSVLRAAAWLHDVLEDTKISSDELRKEFPGYVFLIAEAVTTERGKNRKERNLKTYPKIARFHYACILKLADRISNVRYSKETGDSKYQMYHKEYPEFRAALYSGNIETMMMWWELDRLLDYQGV